MAANYPPYGAPRPVRFVPSGGHPATPMAGYGAGVTPVQIVADDTGYPPHGGPLLLTEAAGGGYPPYGGPMLVYPTDDGLPFLSASFVFLIDTDGAYFVDNDGAYLVEAA
jgi:hypothetical protein